MGGLKLPRAEYEGRRSSSDDMGEEERGESAGDEDEAVALKVLRRVEGPSVGDDGAGDAARDGLRENASTAFAREIPPIGLTVLRR